jgi:hypothetical protein
LKETIEDAIAMGVIMGVVTLMCVFNQYINPWFDPDLANPKYWVPVMAFNWLVIYPMCLIRKYRQYRAAEQTLRTQALFEDVKVLQDSERWTEANRLMDELDRITVLVKCPCGYRGLYPKDMGGESVACDCGKTIKVPYGR